MKVIDLLQVYSCYNDLEFQILDKDSKVVETIKGEDMVGYSSTKTKKYLDYDVRSMRGKAYQSEEPTYFMDNEMRIMVKAKVVVWIKEKAN